MGRYLIDSQRINSDGGLAWIARLPTVLGPGDSPDAPDASTLLLFEDDRTLGPPHALHNQIRTSGGGAYSHWSDHLFFSTSDASDPRSNGHRYTVCRASAAYASDGGDFETNGRFQGITPAPKEQPTILRPHDRWGHLNLLLFLHKRLIYLAPRAKILDFGCGSGDMVYALRDLGFDVYGCDIHDYVDYKSDNDFSYFKFSGSMSVNPSDMRIDADLYKIPFDDNSFDLLYSNSALEHVLVPDLVMAECARVLRPGGIAVHHYPSKYQLIEPHMYVPLASFIQWRFWIKLWATLGIRNEYQCDLTTAQVIKANMGYIKTGLHYLSSHAMAKIARKYFVKVEFFPGWFPDFTKSERAREALKALRDPLPFRALALMQRQTIMCCEKRSEC